VGGYWWVGLASQLLVGGACFVVGGAYIVSPGGRSLSLIWVDFGLRFTEGLLKVVVSLEVFPGPHYTPTRWNYEN